MTDNSATKEPEGKSDVSSIGAAFEERIQSISGLPHPAKDKFWEVTPVLSKQKGSKSIFSLFGKKSVSDAELTTLRQEALQTPGNTRIKLQKISQRFPDHPSILSLSAICLYGMLLNSSSGEIVAGLKQALKDAAQGLMNNGMSLFNLEYFFKIYYTYLDKLKRSQIKVYEQAVHSPDLEKLKKKLQLIIKNTDQLASDKAKTMKVIEQLKKKLKSSNYMTIFEILMVKKAGNAVDQNQGSEKSIFCTNKELIAYLYAMLVVSARTPMLSPLVDTMLDQFASTSKVMHLRKVSIRSVRYFAQYKLAFVNHEYEICKGFAAKIASENWACVQKFDGQPVQQVYESDPYFNLSFIAQLAMGINNPDIQTALLTNALSAMNALMRSDMSKNGKFSQTAEGQAHKLSALKQTVERGE